MFTRKLRGSCTSLSTSPATIAAPRALLAGTRRLQGGTERKEVDLENAVDHTHGAADLVAAFVGPMHCLHEASLSSWLAEPR